MQVTLHDFCTFLNVHVHVIGTYWGIIIWSDRTFFLRSNAEIWAETEFIQANACNVFRESRSYQNLPTAPVWEGPYLLLRVRLHLASGQHPNKQQGFEYAATRWAGNNTASLWMCFLVLMVHWEKQLLKNITVWAPLMQRAFNLPCPLFHCFIQNKQQSKRWTIKHLIRYLTNILRFHRALHFTVLNSGLHSCQ